MTLGGADVDNYQLSENGQQTETTANITANALNVTASGYSGTYDSESHSITVSAPDGVSVTYSESENGTYGADNPAYTNAGTYTVYYKATQIGADDVNGSATVTISKKPVTVSGITAANKPYDGNTDAILNYDNAVFDGIVTGDELTITATGTFESAEVGDGKAVTITDLTLGGADVDNYRLAESGQQTETSANITANVATVWIVTFDTDGGSEIASRSVEQGNAVEEPEAPVKTGYRFSGWQWNGSPYDFSAPVTQDMTLTALWVEQTPKPSVRPSGSFNGDEGSAVASVIAVSSSGYSGAYDGKPHSITVDAPEGALITYSEREDGPYSEMKPALTDAGSLTVWYRVSMDGYEEAWGRETIRISKASVRARLALVDRSDGVTPMTSWSYGGAPGVPALIVENSGAERNRTARFSFNRTLSFASDADAQTFRDYGVASYSYRERTGGAFRKVSSEELSLLDAGDYTLRVDVEESRNFPAMSVTTDFTIAKGPHKDVTMNPVVVARGARNAAADLSGALEADAVCAVSSWEGALLTENVSVKENILRFNVADVETGGATVRLTVATRNYLEYALTVPLTLGNRLALRLDGNGAPIETQTRYLRLGDPYGTLPEPTRNGYAFAGWHTAPKGGEEVNAETRMGGADTTLYAHWNALGHTATLYLEGGKLDSAAMETGWTALEDSWIFRFRTDSPSFLLPEPTRDGYEFTGWTNADADADGDEKSALRVEIPTGSANDVAYRANWETGERTGAATFVAGDKSGRVMGISGFARNTDDDTQTMTTKETSVLESALAATLKELACDDKTSAPGNRKKYVSVFMEARAVSGENQLREERERIERTVTERFEGDRTVETDYLEIQIEKTVSFGSEETGGITSRISETGRVLEIPLRYDLTGRYVPLVVRYHDETEILNRLSERPSEYQDLEGSYYVSGAGNDAVIYIYASRFSAYAVATSGEESYALFFDGRGGSDTESQMIRVKDGGKAARPEDPARAGYDFTDWYASERGGDAFDFQRESVRQDTVLYAGWEARMEESRKIYAVSGVLSHDNDDGEVQIELWRGETLEDSITATMREGRVEYLFRRVAVGEYRIVATRAEHGKNVILTLPVSVGSGD